MSGGGGLGSDSDRMERGGAGQGCGSKKSVTEWQSWRGGKGEVGKADGLKSPQLLMLTGWSDRKMCMDR